MTTLKSSPINALRAAVHLVGSQAKLAKELGTSQGYISDVIRRRSEIPDWWLLPIERATGGKVTRHQLRPDLYEEAAQ